MGALPLGIAGFGTRELGAVVVLGFLGVPSDLATATSLLYGFTAVVQGVIASPLLLLKNPSSRSAARHAGVRRYPERD
jgi:hypothetical protein